MKDWKVFLVLLLALWEAAGERRCQVAVLRSLGFKSKIAPNQFNPLCPNVGYNCCTNTDIMKMHKMWQSISKSQIQGNHASALVALKDVNKVLIKVESLKVKEITDAFKKIVNPPMSFMNHLQRVSVGILDKAVTVYTAALKELLDKKLMESFYKDVLALRRGTLCAMCDWHNHVFIQPASETVIYRNNFCIQMSQKYIDRWHLKYAVLYNFLLLLDEFFLLLTGEGLTRAKDRTMLRRYILMTKRCIVDPKKIDNCIDLCREFNMNTYSFLFDGDKEFLDHYIKKFLRVVERFNDVEEDKIKFVFVYRIEQWREENLNLFLTDESIYSTKLPMMIERTPLPRTFQVKFRSQGFKNFLEYRHVSNSVQLDTMDDEVSAYPLYRMMDPPFRLHDFIIFFEPNRGFNLYRDMKDNQFDITVEELLGLISNGGDLKSLNEIVEKSVILMLNSIEINDIRDFAIDAKMYFKRFPKRKKKPNQKQRSLKSANVLLVFFTALFMTLF